MVTFAGTSLLAVNETQKGKSQLYPNPVNANENVTFGKATDYEVFSVNGQLLKSGKNTKSFSTSNLSKGVYIIKTNEGTQKLIVK